MLFILIGLGFLLIIGIPVAVLVVGTFAVTGSAGLRILFVAVVALITVGLGLLIVVFIPLVRVAQFTLRELVVGGERVFDSIRGGYRLFRRNLGRSLLLWVIQVVLMLAAGVALVIAAILVGLVLFIPTIILAIAEYATAATLRAWWRLDPAAHPSGGLRHFWHFQPLLLDACLPPALRGGRRSRPATRSRGVIL